MTGARSATFIWIAAFVLIVGAPLVALVAAQDGGGVSLPPLHGAGTLVATTLGWSVGVALVTVLLALPAARLIAGAGRSGAWMVGAVCVGLLLPAWALFYAWWTSWPPEGAIFAWATERDRVGFLRGVTLALSLVAVTWPVAVCCLMPGAVRWSRVRAHLLTCDGVTRLVRIMERLRVESSAILVSVVVVAVLVASSTTAFDLAGVFTLSNAMRAAADGGGPLGALLAVGWPLLPMAVLGAWVLWWWLGRDPHESDPARARGRGTMVAVVLVWCVLVAVPVVLLVRAGLDAPGNLFEEHGAALGRAIGRAVLVGVSAFVLTLAMAAHGPRPGWLVRVVAVVWVALALVPAPVTAAATAAAWGWIWPSVLTSGTAWTMGLLIRAGAVAVVAGRWASRSEPAALRDLRLLDGVPWWRPGPTVLLTALGTGVVGVALSLGDVVMVGRLAPPMSEPPLAVTLLNAMHYQRPETVAQILLACVVLAVVGALVFGSVVRVMHRVVPIVLVAVVFVSIPACSRPPEVGEMPVPADQAVGLPGRSTGRFLTPRAITHDGRGGVWVVDKAARVQRVGADGRVSHEWVMPAHDNGKPVGLALSPDGVLIVADTHEHRVAAFDDDGTVLWSLGAYGLDDGAFIYPTDVVFDGSGAMYVSEYGGNDRIQVFSPDRRLLRTIGQPGEAPGAFRRVQSMSLSPDENILWVADSGNHRVQGLDPRTGAVVAVIGDDWLRYPYGVESLPDGSLLVTEFGGHRLSRWTAQGTRLGVWGAWGRGSGQLRMPWGVCHDPTTDRVHVLDTGNARVLSMPRTALGPSHR